MQTTNKIQSYTILIQFILIVILLTLQQCHTCPKLSDRDVIHNTSYDTIKSEYKVIEFKYRTKYLTKYDSVKVTDTVYTENLCDFTRTYNDSIEDSNLTIFNNIEVTGALKSFNQSYKLKIPKYIIRRDSIITVKTETIDPVLTLVAIGGVGGDNTSLNASIGGAIIYRKAYYGYNYNVINKTHNAFIGYKLYSSKR